METQDPDDFLTLLLLLGHPHIDLRAVTVTPGSQAQIGVVRYALSCFGVDIPVGAYNIHHPKACVSSWHYKAYGNIAPSCDALEGHEVLAENCDEKTILITGAALKNIGRAIHNNSLVVRKLVAQGGFAGEGVVPRYLQMEKFKGKVTCPTFNLNGDRKSALAVLEYPGIPRRYFVSKNVCHRVRYDNDLHEQVRVVRKKSMALNMIYLGMDTYLRKKNHKKLHDPLAACCAINPVIAQWEEVELYYTKGGWGSRLAPGSNTWIIVDYDHSLFLETFLAY